MNRFLLAAVVCSIWLSASVAYTQIGGGSVQGVVTAIDLQRWRIEIQMSDGTKTTFLAKEAVFFIGDDFVGDKEGLARLKPGDRVGVDPIERNGKAAALHVFVKGR
jgi:hypothetical protein